MTTPEDLTIPDPPLDSVPYSGLLFYTDSYIAIQEKYADRITTTIGVFYIDNNYSCFSIGL